VVYRSIDEGKGRQSITLLLRFNKEDTHLLCNLFPGNDSTIYAPLGSITLKKSIECTVGSTHLEIRQSALR